MMEITQKEFRQFSDYIHENFGIFLKDEKKTLLAGRLNSFLEQNGFQNFSDYFSHVISDKTGAAAELLVNKISTNYSYFMREAEHFYYLRDIVLPYFEKKITDYDFRIWSAGCATGEEAYTLVFLLDDYFRKSRLWDKTVLATDISERALSVARKGVYDKRQIAPLPGTWKLGCFDQIDSDRYEVKDSMKKQVLFRNFNLVTDSFGFKKPFHVIFLRNVMIYFDNETRISLLKRMYES
jgi:chemotaxis protein methyltransferase CheR